METWNIDEISVHVSKFNFKPNFIRKTTVIAYFAVP